MKLWIAKYSRKPPLISGPREYSIPKIRGQLSNNLGFYIIENLII